MKFSIRDLLLVTVIVAVCVAWWLDRSELTEQKKLLRQSKRGIYTIDGPPPRWEKTLPPTYSAPAANPPKP
jgi:hypothetical protein